MNFNNIAFDFLDSDTVIAELPNMVNVSFTLDHHDNLIYQCNELCNDYLAPQLNDTGEYYVERSYDHLTSNLDLDHMLERLEEARDILNCIDYILADDVLVNKIKTHLSESE